jgi:hypothetical protein
MSRLCCCSKQKKKRVLIRKNSNIDKIIKKDSFDYIIFRTLRGECIICLNDMETNQSATLLKCGHVYHTECIHKWFQRRNVCPVCNIKIKI